MTMTREMPQIKRTSTRVASRYNNITVPARKPKYRVAWTEADGDALFTKCNNG
jgi:hypothetical protein